MRLLGEHRVIPLELSRRMRLAVGFRSVLVHEHVDVRAVTRWLP